MDLKFAFNLIKVEGMWCLLYMLVTLCVGDLSVIGVQPDFALGNDIGRNKLNFGYGVNFKYNGEIHNNLDRVLGSTEVQSPQGTDIIFHRYETLALIVSIVTSDHNLLIKLGQLTA